MATDRKCPSCGGTMLFDPGWDRLLCQSCGYKEVIPELVSKIPVPELDFNSALNYASHDWGMETQIVQCSQCGGETINNKLLLSGKCPFCGSNTLLPAKPGTDVMAPNGIIPFKISNNISTFILVIWYFCLFFLVNSAKCLPILLKSKLLILLFFSFLKKLLLFCLSLL